MQKFHSKTYLTFRSRNPRRAPSEKSKTELNENQQFNMTKQKYIYKIISPTPQNKNCYRKTASYDDNAKIYFRVSLDYR